MGNDKKSWQQPNEDHDGGNDEKQKEAGQKARKDMNLQICQTRTPLSLRALGLLLAGSASTVHYVQFVKYIFPRNRTTSN